MTAANPPPLLGALTTTALPDPTGKPTSPSWGSRRPKGVRNRADSVVTVRPRLCRRVTPLVGGLGEDAVFDFGPHGGVASLLLRTVGKVEDDSIHEARLLHLTRPLDAHVLVDF